MTNYYYKLNHNVIISETPLTDTLLIEISEDKASLSFKKIFLAFSGDIKNNRISFKLNKNTQPTSEGIALVNTNALTSDSPEFPAWVIKAMDNGLVYSLNISNPLWNSFLSSVSCKNKKGKVTISLAGLGDVGGTLLLGLRLLGADCIEKIKIFDLGEDKMDRWLFECSQITSPSFDEMDVKIEKCSADDLFNCDMFVFCVSVGVPKIGDEKEDVRMVQYRGNAKVVSYYASLARQKNFKGTFAVVSDPVDHLCKAALHYSNLDESGCYDGKGLAPDQISGFGLGVMNARAAFYSQQMTDFSSYMSEGRAYGPHGEGLFIADSITNYNHEASLKLTHLTKTANLQVRGTGFKPFIAPALSSGSFSLLAYIRGDWHYSTNFMDDAFFGCRNRNASGLLEIESLALDDNLYEELKNTHEALKNFDPVI